MPINKLRRAAACGTAETVRRLMARADPAFAYGAGGNSLHIAAAAGNIGALAVLAEAVPIDSLDHVGLTPLAHAAMNGQLESANWLLEAGADPDAAGGRGVVALMKAVLLPWRQAEPMMVLLLGAGATVGKAAKNGKTAADYAAFAKKAAAFNMLLRAGGAVGKGANQKLIHAVKHGRLKAVLAALAAGASPNAKAAAADGGRHALHMAIESDSADVAEALLAAHGNPNLTNAAGVAPLHLTDDPRIISALAAARGNVDLLTKDGRSPLAMAASRGSMDAVVRLLDLGADADGAGGISPLSFSIAPHKRNWNSVPLAQTLIDRGADPDGLASDKRHPSPLMAAVGGYDWALAEFLLARGASPNLANAAGKTAMHAAFSQLRVTTLQNETLARRILGRFEHFLAAGGFVDAADHLGNSMLHQSARDGSVPWVKFLIHRGASLWAENKAGKKPIDMVRANPDSHDREIAALLLEAMGRKEAA